MAVLLGRMLNSSSKFARFIPGARPTDQPRLLLVMRLALTGWRGWLAIAALTLLSSVVAMLNPWPLALLMDRVLAPTQNRWVSHAGVHLTILLLASAGVVLFLLDAVAGYLLSRIWISTGQRLVYDLSGRLFAHVQRRSIIFHSRCDPGDLVSRITGDSWCIYNAASSLLFTPAQSGLMLIGATAVLWQIHKQITLLAFVLAPVQALIALAVARMTRETNQQERERLANIESHVQQTFAGIPVVQSFAQEQRELSRFSEMAGHAVQAQRRTALIGGWADLLAGGTNSIGAAVILLVAAREVIAGRLSIGSLQLCMGYSAIIQGEFHSLASVFTTVQGTMPSIDRVMELLEPPIEIRDVPDAIDLPATTAGRLLSFGNVSFGYDPAHQVLHAIDLQIEPGEVVAIVGVSGSGKSTLAALMVRLIDPQEGSIELSGIEIKNLRLASLRQAVSIASQDPVILPESAAANISLGCPDAIREEIERAAEIAGAAQFIRELDEGFDSVLGEMGATLSGGQRQRLAIARAILRNPDLLVLDEPSSALDPESEQQLYRALHSHRNKSQSLVLITHRMATASLADRVIVMSAGRIVEDGTPAELAAADGPYSRMLATASAAEVLS
jgi:ATP-binding cassette subfamily B protein/subfamily B ATP-binding cassette protein MsbA